MIINLNLQFFIKEVQYVEQVSFTVLKLNNTKPISHMTKKLLGLAKHFFVSLWYPSINKIINKLRKILYFYHTQNSIWVYKFQHLCYAILNKAMFYGKGL